MMIKPVPIFLFIALGITSCKQLPNASVHVDLPSQIRSMMYTHRNLLEFQFGSASLKSEQRHQLLIRSYCDLIDRHTVYAKHKPALCQVVIGLDRQKCIAAFHRCINTCPTFKLRCPTCETQAMHCLKEANLDREVTL